MLLASDDILRGLLLNHNMFCLTKLRAQFRKGLNISERVFRGIPSQDGETAWARERHSHKKSFGQDTKRSGVEWMDTQARSERLEKLEQVVPPMLKTKIRMGDVKPADASRDVAEAKSIPPLRHSVRSFPLLSSFARPPRVFGSVKSFPQEIEVPVLTFVIFSCSCCRSRQESWKRRSHGTQISRDQ